jgi:hypothetical protein
MTTPPMPPRPRGFGVWNGSASCTRFLHAADEPALPHPPCRGYRCEPCCAGPFPVADGHDSGPRARRGDT